MYTLGLVYKSLKQHQAAYTMLHRAVDESPNHVAALYELSTLYVEDSQCEHVTDLLSRLHGLSPDHNRAQVLRDKCNGTR